MDAAREGESWAASSEGGGKAGSDYALARFIQIGHLAGQQQSTIGAVLAGSFG